MHSMRGDAAWEAHNNKALKDRANAEAKRKELQKTEESCLYSYYGKDYQTTCNQKVWVRHVDNLVICETCGKVVKIDKDNHYSLHSV